MKKLLLLLPLMSVLFLSNCSDDKDTPDIPDGKGVYDANHTYLGAFRGISNNGETDTITILSPKGYLLVLSPDKAKQVIDDVIEAVYSSSKKDLVDTVYYFTQNTTPPKAVFGIKTLRGSYKTRTWFCGGGEDSKQYPNSKYAWEGDDATSLFVYQSEESDIEGISLKVCSNSEVGLPSPDDIQGPLTTETK